LAQVSDGNTSYLFDLLPFVKAGATRTARELQPLRDLLAGDAIKVIQNAKFDAKFTQQHLGVELRNPFCTMLNSQILACGKGDRNHSLVANAEYFLGIEVDKTERMSDWSQEILEQSQLEYAAKDALILPALYDEQISRLQDLNLMEVSRLENDAVSAVTDMELAGIYLDTEAWREYLEAVVQDRDRVASQLQRELIDPKGPLSIFGNADLNLSSAAQVHDVMENLGIPLPASTEAWRLEPLVQDYPIVGLLLEYRGYEKIMTSFGENILDKVNPVTGRIHPDFWQLGAITTGRFSCSNPNFQQWPKDKVARGSVKAAPGKKLVIADYSQIELRILADRCQDPTFIEAFMSGKDFHATTAASVNGVPIEDVTEDQRFDAKRLNFGMVYGVTPHKFSIITQTTFQEAEQTMEQYFNGLPGLKRYIRDSGRVAICNREARTVSGRILALHFDEKSKSSVSSAMRNGVNQPIQGTSADILKRALKLLHDSNRGTSARLVNIVHDEILLECDASEAEDTARRLEAKMIQAGEEYVKTIPIEVDAVVANEWRKK
jgi:DNA polymerase I-like protein with 3'-5' exonuclease and polymerase domains